ncbi:precorrin-6y C5,15-methyltransferase (decarboxylating) subunit CbiE [Paracoccus sp. 11-3]|uniref:Precorrin-6y C5,15-methyltransferase (Decarboxylating) subunit CbiE n=1 Tax=Paracoccus amoyensis TaxID=2760093 RepID=A0A926JBK3_9RHOB|nr:precorrin-6y C5,15-methyltransferase (decarboxylating) subunit CbiE [Paracoccus amoyensis]MBC9245935.1 precorrin-6y C5,15-methyltransferase (decarboxylating) subunit CbiE [Paracoccus amoyensis]
MADVPWLTVVGLGEDGPAGLSGASLGALQDAEVIMGSARHLSLLPDVSAQRIRWPVPFADGLPILKDLRGRRVAVLASGDPFWFGAGSIIAREFSADEWRSFPAASIFSLAANRLGWALEHVLCIGLHASPMTRLRPHLAPGQRAIVLLRDGGAVTELARYLSNCGFGESRLWLLEALDGPRERVTQIRADTLPDTGFQHPVAAAVEFAGSGLVLPSCSGISDGFFDSDGQMTKQPMRALALSALAPKPSELLWDIGGGSGSIAIEWCLAHPKCNAISIEPRSDRAARIRANADRLGVDRLQVVTGAAPPALQDLPLPQAVFVGGGLSDALMDELTTRLPTGTRLVCHAVTLESEAVLFKWSARIGGDLLRVALSEAAPLGPKRGWKSAYPVVQWRVTL